ncbi:MAG: hypothetical protein JWO86_6784 [Myxococcaceae bacterium]|nr:hypothetical protein [Myxococcaceae bacterium]
MRIPAGLISSLAALGAAGLASMGCATSLGSASGDGRVVVAVDTPTQSSSELVQVTEVVQPVAAEPPAPGRRRLSETVTLGQGTTEPIYVPGQPQQQAGAGANGVVVNNNITVMNGQQPGYGYGGYYGGYGYGGYGRGTGGLGAGRDARGAGMAPNGAWAPSGWEGAQRTAAPGHTPGVGGNWAPPPSFGPRSQR